MTAAKPIEISRREGNPGHRPERAAKLIGGRITEDDTISVPPGFTADHEHAWRELLEPLVRGGVLDWADLPLVELAADALTRARWARVKSARGLTSYNSQGKVTNPLVSIATAASGEFRQIAALLGIGPSNRARFASGAPGAKPDGGVNGEMGRVLPLRALGNGTEAEE